MSTVEGTPVKSGPKFFWFRKAIVLAVILGVGYFIYQDVRYSNLTPCERLSEELLKIASDQTNPIFHIIDFVELHDSPAAGTEIQCSAIAILSNGMKMNVLLKQYTEYGKTWVKSEPQGLPF